MNLATKLLIFIFLVAIVYLFMMLFDKIHGSSDEHIEDVIINIVIDNERLDDYLKNELHGYRHTTNSEELGVKDKNITINFKFKFLDIKDILNAKNIEPGYYVYILDFRFETKELAESYADKLKPVFNKISADNKMKNYLLYISRSKEKRFKYEEIMIEIPKYSFINYHETIMHDNNPEEKYTKLIYGRAVIGEYLENGGEMTKKLSEVLYDIMRKDFLRIKPKGFDYEQ